MSEQEHITPPDETLREDLRKRLNEVFRAKNATELANQADLIGWTARKDRVRLGRMLSGETKKIDAHLITDIVQKLNVRHEFLKTGKGPMFNNAVSTPQAEAGGTDPRGKPVVIFQFIDDSTGDIIFEIDNWLRVHFHRPMPIRMQTTARPTELDMKMDVHRGSPVGQHQSESIEEPS